MAVPPKPLVTRKWTTEGRVLLANIYRGATDGRFYLRVHGGHVMGLADDTGETTGYLVRDWEVSIPGSDRTLELAKQGAEAIIRDRFAAKPEGEWRSD